METILEIAQKDLEYHAFGSGFKPQLLSDPDARIRSMANHVVETKVVADTMSAVLDNRAVFIDSQSALEMKIRQHLVDRYASII